MHPAGHRDGLAGLTWLSRHRLAENVRIVSHLQVVSPGGVGDGDFAVPPHLHRRRPRPASSPCTARECLRRRDGLRPLSSSGGSLCSTGRRLLVSVIAVRTDHATTGGPSHRIHGVGRTARSAARAVPGRATVHGGLVACRCRDEPAGHRVRLRTFRPARSNVNRVGASCMRPEQRRRTDGPTGCPASPAVRHSLTFRNRSRRTGPVSAGGGRRDGLQQGPVELDQPGRSRRGVTHQRRRAPPPRSSPSFGTRPPVSGAGRVGVIAVHAGRRRIVTAAGRGRRSRSPLAAAGAAAVAGYVGRLPPPGGSAQSAAVVAIVRGRAVTGEGSLAGRGDRRPEESPRRSGRPVAQPAGLVGRRTGFATGPGPGVVPGSAGRRGPPGPWCPVHRPRLRRVAGDRNRSAGSTGPGGRDRSGRPGWAGSASVRSPGAAGSVRPGSTGPPGRERGSAGPAARDASGRSNVAVVASRRAAGSRAPVGPVRGVEVAGGSLDHADRLVGCSPAASRWPGGSAAAGQRRGDHAATPAATARHGGRTDVGR